MGELVGEQLGEVPQTALEGPVGSWRLQEDLVVAGPRPQPRIADTMHGLLERGMRRIEAHDHRIGKVTPRAYASCRLPQRLLYLLGGFGVQCEIFDPKARAGFAEALHLDRSAGTRPPDGGVDARNRTGREQQRGKEAHGHRRHRPR
ncbi:MAG: hypothetical protein D6729_09710 [Deltaproteobacteria bacterium]|nr:MAG: hypothetical protein D6729_09710 [Deltaproteobacteria bacterium]